MSTRATKAGFLLSLANRNMSMMEVISSKLKIKDVNTKMLSVSSNVTVNEKATLSMKKEHRVTMMT